MPRAIVPTRIVSWVPCLCVEKGREGGEGDTPTSIPIRDKMNDGSFLMLVSSTTMCAR